MRGPARRQGSRAELERLSEYQASALNASRTGVCLFDAGGRARVWNAAFERLLGFGSGEQVTWASFLARVGGTANRDEEFSYWASGDLFLRVRLVALDAGELLASVDDLTVQERERATRDRFMIEIVHAREQEARRIAELLHEDAVQQLTALGLQLDVAARQGQNEALTRAAALAGEITTALRRLVVELHPAVLESQGLTAAIEASAQSLGTDVAVSVSHFDHRLAPETELTAYRLVQEALANAVRHSGAERVEVELSLAGETLRVRVRDDGTGFDPKDAAGVHDGHLGLHLVRERVEHAGGRFLLESASGSGTTFYFELPLGQADDPSAARGGAR